MAVRRSVKRKPVKPAAKPVKSNPKVPIVDLTKRVVSSGKLAGDKFFKKKVDPAEVEKEWKRAAVIHNLRVYGEPVQRMLRGEFETAFWRGAARGYINPKPSRAERKALRHSDERPGDKPQSAAELRKAFIREVGHPPTKEELAEAVDWFGPKGRKFERRRNATTNPEGPASELYEKFHGKPSERIDIVEEAVHYHEHLTALGDLVELKLKTPTKIRATLRFADEGAPTLASSEDGRQLFVVGGDQKVNLRDIEMDSAQWRRDMMDLGELLEVTYHTVKGFHKFEPTNYFHKLGEETGVKPRILYDTRNERLLVAGGQYAVKPEGIVN